MGIKIITTNRRAFHEYSISDRYEAGLVMTGTEVKAARLGKVNLNESWVDIDEWGQAYLRDAHISKYSHGSYSNHPETRPRKLLLHRKELVRLEERVQQKGMTLIPLKIYFKDQWIKLEIGVAKGKKLHDKRDDVQKKEANRSMERALRGRKS